MFDVEENRGKVTSINDLPGSMLVLNGMVVSHSSEYGILNAYFASKKGLKFQIWSLDIQVHRNPRFPEYVEYCYTFPKT
jgi:hypothetical protein